MGESGDNLQTAAILLIGDEILSGKVVDENAAFLIRELRELGVSLRRISVIPDDVAAIATEVAALSAAYTHVFTSGGVGPTHDDMTMVGVAKAFAMAIARHAPLEQLLRSFYGDKLELRNLRMADLPAEAELVVGASPSWPVVKVRNVYVLPGVPIIFRRKFESIRERFRQAPFYLGCVYLNCDEGALAIYLDQLVAEHPQISCGSYPQFGTTTDYRVKVTIESKDRDATNHATDALAAKLPSDWMVRVERN